VRFLAAAPNPFRRATTIQFDLDRATQVHVEVFDLQGRIVRSLESGWETEGNHRLTWDGTADGSGTVSGGVYFVRVAAGDAVSTRKVLFLR